MALTKHGSITKIAGTSAVADAAIDLKIDKIIEPKKSSCMYFRARAISAGDQGPKDIKWNYNGNLDYFSKAELLKSYATFAGRSLFLNHDTGSPLKAVGKVLDSYPVTDPETHEFYIECLSRIDKNLHPELAGMIENGDLNSVSMGASCGASMCSVCGHTIHSDQDQKCAHFSRLGQKFEAEVDLPEYSIKKGAEVPAFAINSDLTFSELSIVSVPADSAALIKTVIASFQNKLTKIAAQESSEYRDLDAEIQALGNLLLRQATSNKVAADSGDLQQTLFRALDRVKQEHPDVYRLIEEAFNKEVGATQGKPEEARQQAPTQATEQPSAKTPAPAGLMKEAEDNWQHDLNESLIREAFKDSTGNQMSLEEAIEKQLEAGLKLEHIAKAQAAQLGPIETEIIVQKPDVTKPYKLALQEMEDAIYSIGEKVQKSMKDNKPADLEPRKDNPEINTILQKLSGLDYERLQEHIAHKIKAKDTPMENLKAEVAPEVAKTAEVPANLKPHEEGMPAAAAPATEMAEAKDMAKDLPAPDEKGEAAHEAKEVKEEKDELKKLDEATTLIKEVKEEIKEQMKDDKAEEAKLEGPAKKDEPAKEEAHEEMQAMDMGMPKKAEDALTAKFIKKPFLSQSSWEVAAGDKVILRATLREICGEHLPKLRSFVASEQYGKNLIARIKQDGIEAVTKILNLTAAKAPEAHAPIKTSYEAGEHLVATKETPVEKEAAKDSPATLSQAEKPKTEPEGAKAGQHWDKNKDAFASDKVPSEEAKKTEVGTELPAAKLKNSSESVKTEYSLHKEAKLEKGEQTLSEAEKGAAYPAGGAKPEMTPLSDDAKAKEIGDEGSAPKAKNSSDSVKITYEAGTAGKEAKAAAEPEVTKEGKLEPGEMKLSDTDKVKDEFHPKMGTESSTPSDKAKKDEVGREAALDAKVAAFNERVKQLEADLSKKAIELQQEKMERALEAKMQKCRKLVEEMVRRDVLAENQNLVEQYIKQGQNLLDARKSALKDTIDLQLASFMQMPENLLKVQAETIARIKKAAGPSGDKLRIPVQGQFTIGDSDTDFLQHLPWS